MLLFLTSATRLLSLNPPAPQKNRVDGGLSVQLGSCLSALELSCRVCHPPSNRQVQTCPISRRACTSKPQNGARCADAGICSARAVRLCRPLDRRLWESTKNIMRCLCCSTSARNVAAMAPGTVCLCHTTRFVTTTVFVTTTRFVTVTTLTPEGLHDAHTGRRAVLRLWHTPC